MRISPRSSAAIVSSVVTGHPPGSPPPARIPRAWVRARSGRTPRRTRRGRSRARRRSRGASSRSAHASEDSPAGTSTQRYIVASLAATRQPLRSSTSSSTSRFRRYALSRALDVVLVAPGDDRRPLDELLRRCARRGTIRAQRGDDVRRTGDEARAVARHRRALGQRLEDDDVRPVLRAEAPSAAARSNQSSL